MTESKISPEVIISTRAKHMSFQHPHVVYIQLIRMLTFTQNLTDCLSYKYAKTLAKII
jgi:hypothetical protein